MALMIYSSNVGETTFATQKEIPCACVVELDKILEIPRIFF